MHYRFLLTLFFRLEDALGLFRRRKITVEALEKQLEDIAQEETTLQGLLQGIKSQEDITDALADHYTQAEVLLTSFQGQITDTVSFEKKRQVIEFLVAQITIDELTHVEYVFSNGRLSSQHEMPPAI